MKPAPELKEQGRDVRGLARISGLSLDVKLGARMLARYPGVTIVGGLAMTIGVGLGAGYLEVMSDFLRPTLPLHEGERIVGVWNWDVAENDPELRSLHEFVVWREELESVRDLGAFRSVDRNLGAADGPAEPARGAEITPSAFRVARVPALLGRTLVEADEQEGAPPVIVLGYDLWRNRFSGDPGVVGRLAPGVTLGEAQAELSARHSRADERLRPRVVKYTELFLDGVAPEGERRGAFLAQFIFVVLLLVLSSNVATMLFARTATRENEIAMRFALGASRGRILAQFFVEALVLALAATAVGLAVVAWGARWLTRFLWEVTDGRVPFWLDSGLNSTTVLYAVALAVLGSLVAGVMPALKATRSRVQSRLRHSPGAG